MLTEKKSLASIFAFRIFVPAAVKCHIADAGQCFAVDSMILLSSMGHNFPNTLVYLIVFYAKHLNRGVTIN